MYPGSSWNAPQTIENIHNYCRRFLGVELTLKEAVPTLELEKNTPAHIISIDVVDREALPWATVQIGTRQVHGYLTITNQIQVQSPSGGEILIFPMPRKG